MVMRVYITRTVSYYNDETDNLRESFKEEFPTAEIELIDEDSISGIIKKEYLGEFESIEEVKNYVSLLECLVGECFTIYDEDDLVLLEEDFD